MHHRQGTLFTSTILKNYGRDRIFTEKEGFNIAFAIVDLGSEDLKDVAGRELHEYLEIEALLNSYDF